MSAYLYLAAALVFNAAANLLVKYAAIRHPTAPGAGGSVLAAYFTVPFAAGLLCFGLNLLAYTQALKKLPLSLAYPLMVSIGYLLILGVSWSLFGERLAPVRYAGAGLMLVGLWMLTK